VAPKLYKAGEVCELVQVQAYVLRSWEKEFPGIGIQRSSDNTRLYRQSDLDQVQRIKQLVFGEGLTVSGARRRLEEESPVRNAVAAAEVAEVLDAMSADARSRIARVKDGLKAIQLLLGAKPGQDQGARGFALEPPPGNGRGGTTRPAAARSKPVKRAAVSKEPAVRKKAPTNKGKRARLRA
jgi:DNA-binding transcriptional MerR regulator